MDSPRSYVSADLSTCLNRPIVVIVLLSVFVVWQSEASHLRDNNMIILRYVIGCWLLYID